MAIAVSLPGVLLVFSSVRSEVPRLPESLVGIARLSRLKKR